MSGETGRYNVCYRSAPTQRLPLPAPTDDVDLLFEDEQYRAYFISIGGDPAKTPRVVSLSNMGGAPSATTPFFNDYTNVLTVPAPDEAMLRRILRGTIDRVEQAIPYAVPRRRREVRSDCSLDVDSAERVPDGVNKIEAPEVWANGYTGRNVSIAIVDTGLEEHPDLPRPWAALSFVPGDNSTVDKDGHGNFVTGVALARLNRRQLVGVAHASTLIVARAGNDQGQSEDSWVAAAITWSALRGARVINVCLVSNRPSEAMRRAVVEATRKSIICAAAGNGGADRLDYPAAYPQTISVGATLIKDVVCGDSNWTVEMTTSAPGCPILSTTLGDGTTCESGSSAATPHVSGVVALMLEKDPNMTLDQIRKRIQDTGVEVMGGGAVTRISAVGCIS